MVRLNDVYRRVEDKWVSRFIFDEVVIMPLCRTEEDMQYIYSISNETGSRIWQLLDGEHSVRDTQEILKSEYQGQGEVIEREVLEFIVDVFEAGLVEKAEETRDEGRGTKDEGRKTKDEGRESTIESPQCPVVSKSPQLKKAYKSPEIARIKMQPEQAVLSCCVAVVRPKNDIRSRQYNVCGERVECAQKDCVTWGGLTWDREFRMYQQS